MISCNGASWLGPNDSEGDEKNKKCVCRVYDKDYDSFCNFEAQPGDQNLREFEIFSAKLMLESHACYRKHKLSRI